MIMKEKWKNLEEKGTEKGKEEETEKGREKETEKGKKKKGMERKGRERREIKKTLKVREGSIKEKKEWNFKKDSA